MKRLALVASLLGFALPARADVSRQQQVNDLLEMNAACRENPKSANCVRYVQRCAALARCEERFALCPAGTPAANEQLCAALKDPATGCEAEAIFRSRCEVAGRGELRMRDQNRDYERADGELHVSGVKAVGPNAPASRGGGAGTSVRVVSGMPGLALSGNVELGGLSQPGGFSYDANVGLGVGSRLGAVGMLTLTGGVGVGGITGRAPIALQVPIELYAAVSPTKSLRLFGFARDGFAFFSAARQGGAPHALFGDTLHTGFGVRIGRLEETRSDISTGFFFGVTYSEIARGQYLGLMLGLQGTG